MRAALLSLSAITAAGVTLGAGGAYSVFNNTSAAAALYENGTVKLSLGDNTLRPAGDCSGSLKDNAGHLATDQNMGSQNNTDCTSTIPVTNAGTLPLLIDPASIVTDQVKDSRGVLVQGSTCFTSTLTPADLAGPIYGGSTRTVHVTTMASSDNACQGDTDTVTASIKVNESLPLAQAGQALAAGRFPLLTVPLRSLLTSTRTDIQQSAGTQSCGGVDSIEAFSGATTEPALT